MASHLPFEIREAMARTTHIWRVPLFSIGFGRTSTDPASKTMHPPTALVTALAEHGPRQASASRRPRAPGDRWRQPLRKIFSNLLGNVVGY